MDPFSVLCGVAGLISLAQVVVQEGYNYISTAKGIREDISNLINEVAALSGILVALKTLADDLGKAGYSPAITKPQQISDCEDVLRQLKDLLRRISPTPEDKNAPTRKIEKTLQQKNNRAGKVKNIGVKEIPITERIKELVYNTGKIATWPLNRDETMELVDRLARHKTTFILTLSADNTAALMDILHKAQETNYHIVDVRSEQSRVAEAKREEDRTTKLCWLFPGDPDEKHTDILQKRHEGTGDWFFESEEFKRWLHEASWLFCHGKAGAGKTVLISAVLDYIETSLATDGSVGLAKIYCGYKDRDEQTPTKIFASVLRQLGFQKSTLPPEIESLYKTCTAKGKNPLLQDLIQAIISLAGSFSRVWLFFDALDECDETKLPELLSCMGSLMETNIQGFVTSRSHVSQIRSTFEKAITVELSARGEDIEIFVRSKLSTRPKPLADRLVEEVVSRVLEKADGIFLLVAFQVGVIISKIRPTDVRKCLDRLPTGLDSIYENILQKINRGDEDNRELALNALSWISHATRPLHPKELREALTIAEGDSVIEDEDLLEEKQLVDVCGGLVVVDENSQTVRFVHYTVQEYLEKSSDISHGKQVHALMAKTCLTYLSLDAFDECPDGGMNTAWLARRVDRNALYEYAACNWGYPTNSSGEEQSVLELICKFSESGNRAESALHVFLTRDLSLSRRGSTINLSNSRNTFSVAAIVGLPRLTRSLLQRENLEVDLEDRNYNLEYPYWYRDQTPLSRAAENGNSEVVRLLVDRSDVDADSKDSWERTPLSYAAEGGHLAIAKLLVGRDDVDVDAKDISCRTPLSYAAQRGHLEVVKLLADREDVNADSKDYFGRTPICYAARNRHLDITRLLANRDDVNTDTKDRDNRTPLSFAAEGGDLEVVQLLVDRDSANADTKDRYSRTPLYFAAEGRHLAVVQLLIDRDDVDINSKDIDSQTPLSHATALGHLAVAQLLADRQRMDQKKFKK